MVSEEHLNLGGTLHGGFTSTLIDCISTYALMTKGNGVPGVSVDLNVSYEHFVLHSYLFVHK